MVRWGWSFAKYILTPAFQRPCQPQNQNQSNSTEAETDHFSWSRRTSEAYFEAYTKHEMELSLNDPSYVSQAGQAWMRQNGSFLSSQDMRYTDLGFGHVTHIGSEASEYNCSNFDNKCSKFPTRTKNRFFSIGAKKISSRSLDCVTSLFHQSDSVQHRRSSKNWWPCGASWPQLELEQRAGVGVRAPGGGHPVHVGGQGELET